MPYRGNVFEEGGYYHIYNRGAGKGKLFFNPGNYCYCLELLKRCCQKYKITAIAYCLMPNHYHFLLRQDSDLSVSKFIHTLFNAYTQAINRQQKRAGTLFEGRFRHALVARDEYFVHLCRYIHLNPVKARLVSQSSDWPYSDYLDWIGKRKGDLEDKALVREYFPKEGSYEKFVLEYQEAMEHNSRINKYLWD